MTGQMCEWLSAAGYKEVSVAELDDEDVLEDAAAEALAKSLAGSGVRHDTPVNGRCNLRVAKDGILRVNVPRLSRLNLIDEAIALATVADRHPVRSGDVVATVKIIPLALDSNLLWRATAIADQGILHLTPYQMRKCGVILTRSPLRKASVIRKTVASLQVRISQRGGVMMTPRYCLHDEAALAGEIADACSEGADIVLIAGASAVADREDVAPRAVKVAGGRILRFGMPVFPGNLVCLGKVGRTEIVVLPGCVGNDQFNGADLILDRLFTGEAVTSEAIAQMGAGGLLSASAATSSITTIWTVAE